MGGEEAEILTVSLTFIFTQSAGVPTSITSALDLSRQKPYQSIYYPNHTQEIKIYRRRLAFVTVCLFRVIKQGPCQLVFFASAHLIKKKKKTIKHGGNR